MGVIDEIKKELILLSDLPVNVDNWNYVDQEIADKFYDAAPDRLLKLMNYVEAAEAFRIAYFEKPYAATTKMNEAWFKARQALGLVTKDPT